MNTPLAINAYDTVAKQQVRDDLILKHLGFVKKVMGKISGGLPSSVDRENLESAGIVGLIEAADRYDASRNVPFETYSYRRIYGAIIDELRKNCPLSQNMIKQISALNAVYETLEPPVTVEMLAEKSGQSIKVVEECLEAIRLTNPKCWNELFCQVHASWNPIYEEPNSKIEAEELQNRLAKMMTRLTDRQREVITMYYLEDMKQLEIGAVLGVSEGRVSRILSQAVFRLKELLRSQIE